MGEAAKFAPRGPFQLGTSVTAAGSAAAAAPPPNLSKKKSRSKGLFGGMKKMFNKLDKDVQRVRAERRGDDTPANTVSNTTDTPVVIM